MSEVLHYELQGVSGYPSPLRCVVGIYRIEYCTVLMDASKQVSKSLVGPCYHGEEVNHTTRSKAHGCRWEHVEV